MPGDESTPGGGGDDGGRSSSKSKSRRKRRSSSKRASAEERAAHRKALQARMDTMGGWTTETRVREKDGAKDTYWFPPLDDGKKRWPRCRSWREVEKMLDRIDAERAE